MTAPQMTSVIMVSYHTGPVLGRAIEAVMGQTANVELILINNGNPPDVETALIKSLKDEPLVRLMTGHGNIGFARGCNLGARVARGDHLLFLNPDSLLPPDAVAHLHRVAEGLKRPFMVGARLVDQDGRDQRGCRRELLTPLTALVEAFHLHKFFPKMRLNRHEEPLPERLGPMPAISGAFMFMPATDFRLVNGFDEGYFLHVEDLDLCWRFRQAGGEIYFDPSLTVTHVGSTSKTTNVFLERQKAKGFVRYFDLHFGKTTPRPFLWLLDAAIWFRFLVKSVAGK